MPDVLQVVEECRRTGDFSRLIAAIPYAAFLGLAIERSGSELVTKLSYVDRNIGNPALPALHGGVVAALLESAAIFEVLWSVEAEALPRIVTITVDYLRSAGPTDAWARAVVTRQGRRVVNVRAEAWQEDPTKPIASASCHLLICAP